LITIFIFTQEINMKRLTLAVAIVLGIASIVSAMETTYTGQIRQLFGMKCAGCHGTDAASEYQAFKADKDKWLAKSQGPRMDSYSHLIYYTAWPDTGALMRRLDDGKSTKDGKPGNMYRHLGATDEERQQNLAAFKAWVGNWSLRKWSETTKVELDGITVKY
jgi:hypothetical protein